MRKMHWLPTVFIGVSLLALSPDVHAQAQLGQSGLVGTREGITIVTDPAKWPKVFQEAPALAALVKDGKYRP